MRIRAFRRGDEAALAEICLRTADAGGDATGILIDDAIWSEIFLLPYLARHPDLAYVVDGAQGACGYAVCAPDTDAFEGWFREQWWPPRSHRWPLEAVADTRTRELLRYAAERAPGRESAAARYPAHLHVDLLPEAQGRGLGRALIETAREVLRERGVPGIHLVAAAENTAAHAFYDRLGFARLPATPGAQAFVCAL